MNRSHEFDAVVVGAGVAGCVAAIRLVRANCRVAVVERAAFPRDKVCGECVSALGVDVLDSVGVLDRIRAAGSQDFQFATTYTRCGRTIRMRLPRPMLGISRSTLDSILIDAAREAGATVVQPARVQSIESNAVRLLDGRSISTRITLVAAGSPTLCGRRIRPTGDFGVKCHFENGRLTPTEIALFAFAGRAYGGIAAIESSRFNFAASIPAERLQTCAGDLDQVLDELRNESPAFDRALSSANRVGDWQACPLPRFGVAGRWPANVVPIGNAAAAIEPVGGEGMGVAMASAVVAADEIGRAFAANMPIDFARVRRRFRSLYATRSVACRLAARALTAGPIVAGVASAASGISVARSLVMRLVGKRRSRYALIP